MTSKEAMEKCIEDANEDFDWLTSDEYRSMRVGIRTAWKAATKAMLEYIKTSTDGKFYYDEERENMLKDLERWVGDEL